MEYLFSKLDPAQFFDPSSVAGPLYVFFIVFEILYIWKRKRGGDYESRDTAASLIMGSTSLVSRVLFGFIGYFIVSHIYAMRIMDIPTTPLMLVVLLFVDDFRYYWSHRLSHRIRWCWANHVVHHSSQHFNLSTALRQPVLSSFTGLVILYSPFALLGVHPGAIAFVGSANLIYQFFIHTETVGKLPRWCEAVFNTPSHHRVHHSTKPEHLDTNYAGIFIIWDRMFSTFAQEKDNEAMQYGLVYNLGTFNPLRIATHEFVGIFKDISQKGLKFSQRFAYMFAPPGWSHDGSRLTSVDIKKQAQDEID